MDMISVPQTVPGEVEEDPLQVRLLRFQPCQFELLIVDDRQHAQQGPLDVGALQDQGVAVALAQPGAAQCAELVAQRRSDRPDAPPARPPVGGGGWGRGGGCECFAWGGRARGGAVSLTLQAIGVGSGWGAGLCPCPGLLCRMWVAAGGPAAGGGAVGRAAGSAG